MSDEGHAPDRRGNRRRREDELRAWAPLILSILSTLVVIVLAYGRIGARLDLIEYRLTQIEKALAGRVVVP